jgi:ureidoacrylate peracid hydrolase
MGSLKDCCRRKRLYSHILQVLGAARKAELRVFYALHRRYRPDDYETWKYIAPVQKAAWLRKSFEYRHVGVARSAASSSLNRAKSGL